MGVEKTSRPELRLVGHKKEGYGISWNQHEKGHLISASEDGSICMWDINANTVEENRVLQALRIFNTEQVVEDVDWHPKHSYMFASVGDDRRLMLWDTRESSNNTASKSVLAHSSEVNCVKFNPKSEYLVATGSTDTTIALWDIRKISSKLHTLETHTGEILQLEWMSSTQPTASPTILASSSGDRRVNVWDISRIGDEQSVEDAADGPPELLFVHGGHTSRVCDISWNFNEPWTMCSVAEDNVVQVWQMSSNIYGGGDQLVEDRMVTDDQ
ncbi:Histone-binding protein RBBP7 [Zancudomyces culisetae]|uniref:Histone-binding protein RBBP7 n=1 Tax=Zancudomyces culisetae TaxID=1213189 RepID=A0A1R1PQN8_ZANCU|nr:Histone-binding protein RBBP7 [Zancudomyces culisetae]OMH83251.1 Histone-binding protein RBBP7 [Zancudomyces culisetae]|eukprot:OMH83093.1 Histone-binding protein RBBP7 [Zancudomyces culisetae]